jgi:hypothetical protein
LTMQTRFGRAGGAALLGALATLAYGSAHAKQPSRRAVVAEDRLLGIQLVTSTYRDVLRKFGPPSEIQAGGPFLPTPPPGTSANNAAAPGMGMPGGGYPGSGGRSSYGGGGGPGGAPSMTMPGGPGGGGGGGGKRVPSHNGFPGKNDGGGGAAGPGMGGPGGYPGMGGSGGYPGGYPGMGGTGGGPSGYPGGYPGMGGSGGYPGMGGSGGYPGGYPGASGGGPQGMGGAMPGVSGPGLPGFQNAGGPQGVEGGPGYPGMPGEGGGPGIGNEQEGPIQEATWWYHNHAKGTHFSFLFNKEGRVIQIQEYGPYDILPGGRTQRGVGLGSGMDQVLKNYGWSNDGAHDGQVVILRYGKDRKVAFQLSKNKVLGITVGLVK